VTADHVLISANPSIGRVDRTYHRRETCWAYKKIKSQYKKLILLSKAEERGHAPCQLCCAKEDR